ncbi:hypothetical protein GCM10010404_81840 [Nonomuraea africana]|uniref:Type II secretory pathway pseudopilin PulG n=1 Tax=Nonomuraea africana TaxID=46171 RepID=A0ABR9KX18_9ACTN|nr:hypothetical protein [Nonomuraea africana]MBE1566581.1 type II secretory pathway pseudopilin PulG [Nonomuraea africana]
MTKARELDRDFLGDVLFLGIGIVVLWVSFDTLTHLAELAGWKTVWDLPNGWTIRMAWALPVAVDFYAIATARVWLMRRWWISDATRDHARLGAWWAIGGSVGLNSVSHALMKLQYRADSWHGASLAVLIGAVPPVVLAAIAHLRAMQNQDRAEAVEKERARAERAAEQHARRAETKAGTGRPESGGKPGTAPVPAPAVLPGAGAGAVPVPADAAGAGTGPGGSLPPTGTGTVAGTGRPKPPPPAPTPTPAPRRQQEQQPDPAKGTTLLTSKDLDFAEQYMADHPGVTPTKQDLMDCGLGSGRALRIRAYIDAAVKASGTGPAPQTTPGGAGTGHEKPVPDGAGTVPPPPPGTASSGTVTASPDPTGTAPGTDIGTDAGTGPSTDAGTGTGAGTELVAAGTNVAVNE